MFEFELSQTLACSQQDLFQYHARPGALNRLIPPWERVQIEQRSDSLEVGSEVVLRNSIFGIPVRWRARHTGLDEPRSFQDIQLSGPFKTWQHDHLFETVNSAQSRLTDRVHFEMKFGSLGRIGLPVVRSKLSAMFRYRHRTTQADLELQDYLSGYCSTGPLKIGVTGSNGMIGRRLVDLISVLGHHAIRIIRPDSTVQSATFPLSSSQVLWDRKKGFSDSKQVEGLDAVIHLAGKGIASVRWTDTNKKAIRDSRVEGTSALVRDLSKLRTPPAAFVSASGVGVYGDRGDRILDESISFGIGFLADLARDWEAAAGEFAKTGNRVAVGRLGIALHPLDGALSKLLTPFCLGVGGRIGSGRQYWGWIDIDDAAAAFLTLALNPSCEGPYNLVAPEQVTNQTFAKTLGKVLRRPSLVPAPAIAMRFLLGEMADSMLLASTRASSKRLQELAFPFRNPSLEGCLRHVLGRPLVA